MLIKNISYQKPAFPVNLKVSCGRQNETLDVIKKNFSLDTYRYAALPAETIKSTSLIRKFKTCEPPDVN
jgi:hypothetical protein